MARQIKRFLHSELKHVSKWTYALIPVIYACMVVLQLNSFPMWFCSLRENSFLGFFPDPTLLLSAEDVLLFGNAEVFRGAAVQRSPVGSCIVLSVHRGLYCAALCQFGLCRGTVGAVGGSGREAGVRYRCASDAVFFRPIGRVYPVKCRFVLS